MIFNAAGIPTIFQQKNNRTMQQMRMKTHWPEIYNSRAELEMLANKGF